MEKRPALGKGLSALIPDAPEPPPRRDRSKSTSIGSRRTTSSRAARSTMRGSTGSGASISANGVIQPIVVRRVGDRFQIIAGERRWRAAQERRPAARAGRRPRRRAGQERSLLEMALDRKHPARGSESDRRSARLPPPGRRVPSDAGRRSRRRSARIARRSRTIMRLLRLPARSPRRSRSRAALSMGHARALLALADEADQRRSRATSSRASLSVRETESLVKKIERRAGAERNRRAEAGRRAHTRRRRSLEARCSARASASSVRARAAASKSTSDPKTS